MLCLLAGHSVVDFSSGRHLACFEFTPVRKSLKASGVEGGYAAACRRMDKIPSGASIEFRALRRERETTSTHEQGDRYNGIFGAGRIVHLPRT